MNDLPPVELVINKTITYCVECPHHIIAPDPDIHDWFNYDDKALLCELIPKDSNEVRFTYGIIDSMLRPHETSKIKPPANCPLRSKQ